MDEPTRAVLGHVHRRELVDLADALIRIPSFKTEETQVALFLEKFFRQRAPPDSRDQRGSLVFSSASCSLMKARMSLAMSSSLAHCSL